MRIAELLPEQTLATVEVVWRDTSAAYLGLENQVEGSNGERRLNSEFRPFQPHPLVKALHPTRGRTERLS